MTSAKITGWLYALLMALLALNVAAVTEVAGAVDLAAGRRIVRYAAGAKNLYAFKGYETGPPVHLRRFLL